MDANFIDLLERAGMTFIGTVVAAEGPPNPTASDLGPGTVVKIDQIVHAPAVLSQAAGLEVLLQRAPKSDLLDVGDRATFFVNTVSLGKTILVQEIGRLPAQNVERALVTAQPNLEPLQSSTARLLDRRRLQARAAKASAAVIGRVVRLEKAGPERNSEHDPDWWVATIQVQHVENGPVTGGDLRVLYANSLDVRWYKTPKPKAGQEGLWLLHDTVGDQLDLARFSILEPEDYRPATDLSLMRS